MLATKSKIDKLQNALDNVQSSKNNKLDKFSLALRDLVEENYTFYSFSKRIDVTRESLYKTLSIKGNPKFSTLLTIVKALDLKLTVVPKTEK